MTTKKKMWVTGAAGLVLICAILLENQFGREVTEITRPEPGETASYVLEEVLRGETVTVTLHGRMPDAGEAEDLLDAAFQEFQDQVLSGKSEVSSLPAFPENISEDITASVKSLTPEIVTDEGLILFRENDPNSEKTAVLSVTLFGFGTEKTYELEFTVFREREEEDLSARLHVLEAENREDAVFYLPNALDDRKLSFQNEKTAVLPVVLLLILTEAAIVIIPGEREKEQKKKRLAALKKEYPATVMKLALLILSGQSVPHAISRVVSGYRKGQKDTAPVCEELSRVLKELSDGVSEPEAYEAFGNRCMMQEYVLLASLLSQRVTHGNEDMSIRFRQALADALAEQKNQNYKNAEIAGTKLLGPMTLLLVMIMMILMVPALGSL